VLGALAQDPVDAAGVEAEGAQPSLQVGDVVAPERGIAPVEQPVAEAIPGLDQCRPRLLPADPVDAQAARGLEGATRRLGPVVEASSRIARRVEPDGGEPPLEVTDSLALAASAERETRYRN